MGASSRVLVGVVSVLTFVFAIILPSEAQRDLSPAQAPAPSSDGASIDQGIAYVLMFVALIVTYLVHPLDASW